MVWWCKINIDCDYDCLFFFKDYFSNVLMKFALNNFSKNASFFGSNLDYVLLIVNFLLTCPLNTDQFDFLERNVYHF